ncbi:MAG: efflux transporter periplasmic adaptor subunit, partial [Firmicutes bacterium]|nr:efflux transporter periplasmic adaptor subunit [Bacillota bacterium]
GIYSIFVIEDGLAVKKTVEAGYSSPSRTEILSGLSEGDDIIDRVESEGVYEGAQVRYED